MLISLSLAEYIYRIGDVGHEVYIIARGQVDINFQPSASQTPEDSMRLNVGDVFGVED